MKRVHILSCIGVLCMIYIGDTSWSEKVNIGAVFSLDTIDGKVSQIAIQAAVEEINSDPNILGGHTLSLHIHNSNDNGFLSVVRALQFMETETVAIIGPQSSKMAHIISHLGNELHVPLLSFTALDPLLSPIQYPYFFQTAPSDLFQMKSIAEVVSYFGWKQVIAIFTADVYSRNGITVLQEELAKKGFKISYKAVLPLDIRGKEAVVLQELAKVKLMGSRVLVVHTLATYGPILLKAAEQLGLVDDGYVWIATSWLSSILDSMPQPEIFKVAQGVVTFRLHTPDSERKRAFVNRWNQLSNGSIGLNVYGLYAYDTVWLIAHAMKAFLHQGNHILYSSYPILNSTVGGKINLSTLSIFDGGKDLLNIILKTNLYGLTGRIRFKSGRYLVNPSYDIINIVGNQLRQIGYWSNNSGLSVVAPETLHYRPQNSSSATRKLNSVVWPGGTKQPPHGWAFPRDGRKLRIGVPLRAAFQEFVNQDNRTHNIHGYCIDIFLAALKRLPYVVDYEFIPFGDGHQTPSYDKLVEGITMDEFDAAVGDIAIVTSRTKMVDFTQPYIDSGLVVVVPTKSMNSGAWIFLSPFTPQMWAVTAAFVFIVGAVIWILEHRLNDKFRGPPRKQLRTCLWFSFSSLFSSAQRERTLSKAGRMILAIWVFVFLIIQQSYTASLTSFLTVQQLSSPIKIDTLITSSANIGFQIGSFAENYLHDELHIPRSRLKSLKSPEEYADALKNGKVAAVVDEEPYIDLFLSKHCGFMIADQQFAKRNWAFAFKKDSPLAFDMSTALLKLSENGSLQNITGTWLKNRTACKPKILQDLYQHQLNLNDFIGLFAICGGVSIIALIIYFCSQKHQFHRHPGPEPPSNDSSSSTHLSSFLSFVKKKDGLTRRRLKRSLSI